MRFAIVAILAVGWAAAQQSGDDDVSAYLKERRATAAALLGVRGAAEDDLKAGRFAAAEAEFHKLNDLEGVARVYLAQNRTEEALGLLKSLAGADNARGLAGTLIALNREDLAIDTYQQALAAGEKRVEIYQGLGELYGRRGDWNAALDAWRKAHELRPDSLHITLSLSGALDAVGRKDEAGALLRDALGVDPNDAHALARKAVELMQAGPDQSMALTCIRRALALAPDDLTMDDIYGQILSKKMLANQALGIYRGLVDKDPRNPLFHYHLAIVLAQTGNHDGLVAELHKALDCNPPEDLKSQIESALASTLKQQ